MCFNAGANLKLFVVFTLIKRILLLNGRVRQMDAAARQVRIVNGHNCMASIIHRTMRDMLNDYDSLHVYNLLSFPIYCTCQREQPGMYHTLSEPVCSSRGGRRPPSRGSCERLEDSSECRTSSVDPPAPPKEDPECIYHKEI